MPDFSEEEQSAASSGTEHSEPDHASFPEKDEEEIDECLPDQHFPVVGIGASAGSAFSMLFPATESARIKSPAEPAAQDLKGTGLILVVDDEAIVQQTMKAILERNGYEVLTAANGELAVEAVRTNKERLAAVVLDLTMPVMGGEAALAHIEKIAPALPVILASGYDTEDAISRFGEDRLAGFLQKPSTVSQMLQTVQQAVRKRTGGPRNEGT
jgi:CheY-like chemotaxis protein